MCATLINVSCGFVAHPHSYCAPCTVCPWRARAGLWPGPCWNLVRHLGLPADELRCHLDCCFTALVHLVHTPSRCPLVRSASVHPGPSQPSQRFALACFANAAASCAPAALPDAAGTLWQAASVAQELDPSPAILQQQPTALLAQLSSGQETFQSAHSDTCSESSSSDAQAGTTDTRQQGSLPAVLPPRGVRWPCPSVQSDHEQWLPKYCGRESRRLSLRCYCCHQPVAEVYESRLVAMRSPGICQRCSGKRSFASR
jgi:hypothetical protein